MITLIGGALGAPGRYSGVTMSVGAYNANATLSGLIVGKDDPALAVLGGQVTELIDPNTFRQYNQPLNLTLVDGSRTGIGGRLAFETTANLFEFSTQGLGTNYFNFSLRVNGLLYDTPVFSGGSNRWVQLDLTALGLGQDWRTVEIEFGNSGSFGGVALEAGAQIRAPQAIGPRLVLLGDSFTEGTGASRPGLDYATLTGYQLGAIDIWQSAFGGTGYERALGTRLSLAQRIEQDGVNAQGDIYVVAMGINDSTDITSEVRDSLTALTEGRPGAKIFVVGSWNAWAPTLPANGSIINMIRQVTAEFPSVVFLDSDRVGFTHADNTHPDDAGHQTLADWLSAQIHASMGMDGVVDQNTAGDIVGPVFIDDFDPALPYTFEVLEDGLASARFELVATGDAFPILRLKAGQQVADLGAITITVRITSSTGAVQQNPLTFEVRQRLTGDSGNNALAGSGTAVVLEGLDGHDYLTGTSGTDRIEGGNGNDHLQGLGGNDVLRGGAGDDIVYVETIGDIATELPGEGYDTLHSSVPMAFLLPNFEKLVLEPGALSGTGSDLADILVANNAGNRLFGLLGADTLIGGAGTDVLNGGAGADIMQGGAGDDSYIIDNSGDLVFETLTTAAGDTRDAGGIDTISNPLFSFNLNATNGLRYVENLTLTGSAYEAIGNALDNILTGTIYSNRLSGGLGADTLHGNSGDDYLYGEAGNDRLNGDAGLDRLWGGAGTDILDGGDGNDVLVGDEGDDALAGGSGNDTLYGNNGIDHLAGGDGNDHLEGGAGADLLHGGAGDDGYIVDDAGDRVVETLTTDPADINDAGGFDSVFASVSYSLATGGGQFVEKLRLTGAGDTSGTGNGLANWLIGNEGANLLEGLGGADTLIGGGGNDRLDGGSGSDTMQGGAGDDSYVIDNAGDMVFETLAISSNDTGDAGGNDTITSYLSLNLNATFGLRYVESLVLAGSAYEAIGNALDNTLTGTIDANRLSGGLGADTLHGNSGDDYLYGEAGHDRLNGDAGLDRLWGGAGNDILDGGDGNDVLVGDDGDDALFGDTGSDTLYGGIGADQVSGGEGNDHLEGGAGPDVMHGGAGDDGYIVDDAGDRVVETLTTDPADINDAGGFDSVFASVSYSLATGGGQFVEKLRLTGTGDISGTGNGLANWIVGNTGANLLDGLAGADTLIGGAGADLFRFTSREGVDNLPDMAPGIDRIELSAAAFAGLAPGALAPSGFGTGNAAMQADQRLIYNPQTGALLFDADGTGVAAAIQFAQLSTGLALSAGDFLVI